MNECEILLSAMNKIIFVYHITNEYRKRQQMDENDQIFQNGINLINDFDSPFKTI